jgi:hypothetical protein
VARGVRTRAFGRLFCGTFAKDRDGQNVWAGSGHDTCALDLEIDLYTSCETIL